MLPHLVCVLTALREVSQFILHNGFDVFQCRFLLSGSSLMAYLSSLFCFCSHCLSVHHYLHTACLQLKTVVSLPCLIILFPGEKMGLEKCMMSALSVRSQITSDFRFQDQKCLNRMEKCISGLPAEDLVLVLRTHTHNSRRSRTLF